LLLAAVLATHLPFQGIPEVVQVVGTDLTHLPDLEAIPVWLGWNVDVE